MTCKKFFVLAVSVFINAKVELPLFFSSFCYHSQFSITISHFNNKCVTEETFNLYSYFRTKRIRESATNLELHGAKVLLRDLDFLWHVWHSPSLQQLLQRHPRHQLFLLEQKIRSAAGFLAVSTKNSVSKISRFISA